MKSSNRSGCRERVILTQGTSGPGSRPERGQRVARNHSCNCDQRGAQGGALQPAARQQRSWGQGDTGVSAQDVQEAVNAATQAKTPPPDCLALRSAGTSVRKICSTMTVALSASRRLQPPRCKQEDKAARRKNQCLSISLLFGRTLGNYHTTE